MNLRRIFQNGEHGRAGAKGTRVPLARKKKRQRGVALMIAIISIAVLTATSTEFLYTSRVDLQMAGNQRDDLRAYFLARSGIGLSRLMLSFQKQVDNIQLPPGIMDMLGPLAGLSGGAGGLPGAAGAGGPPMPTTPSIQLWKMAKIDCYMLQGLVASDGDELARERVSESLGRRAAVEGGAGEGAEALPQDQRDFGTFTGCFDVQIEAEEPKINLNALEIPNNGVLEQALAVFGDKQFEFLFEREDSNNVRVTPQELLINIKDWMDQDQVASTIQVDGLKANFVPGFSDENSGYSRYTPRYQAKNARYDSLDEVFMVHGINDRMMNVFRERFTVYGDPNQASNINTDDPILLWGAILRAADPAKPDPRLRDPLFVAQVIQAIRTARMFSFLGMSVKDFVAVLQQQGIAVRGDFAGASGKNFLSDKNSTFTVTATGEAGAIRKKITAVIRMDKGQLGQLVYWREE